MTDFLSSSQSLNVDGPEWLSSVREAGDTLWQAYTLPGRKTEDWKYTNLNALKKRDFFTQALPKAAEGIDLAGCFNIPGLDAETLVFVNGEFNADLSSYSTAPKAGVAIVRFSEANTEQQALISEKINGSFELENHGFAALNSKCLNEGVLVHVSANTQTDKPVHIVSLTTHSESDFSVNARALVVLEKSAEAAVFEHFASDSEKQENFTNSLTEFFIGENASLKHYRLQEEQESSLHVGGVHARLEKNARLNSFYLALGSLIKRIDVTVTYAGEGAEATINGIYLPKNKQHIDFHTCIEHAVPHCNTHEVFRGIVADESRAVFNGRIHIHRDAQKTEAYLSNKNLLTSNKAEVDTKPELEIYADDVRCAHGATIAQLDPTSVHYLKTRGVSQDEALVMLSFGFINELLGELKLEPIANYFRPKLAASFSRDPELTRHLL